MPDHLIYIFTFEEDADKNKVLEDLSDGTLILSFSYTHMNAADLCDY